MGKFKTMREQFTECLATHRIRREKCHKCGQVLLMCLKYGGMCESKKCRDERILQMEKEVEPIDSNPI